MKYKSIVCAIAAASFGMASLSTFAQGYDRGDDRRGDHRGDARGQMGHRDGYRNDHYAYGARGAEWHSGGRVPPQYRERQYVVSDWRGHHLNAPPRGYQWVQVGSDYVLVAIATGIIAQLLLSQ